MRTNLAGLEQALSGDGYRILRAFSGDEALTAVDEHRPDLVLMDIHMPGTDGIAVCRRLKHDHATRLLPVVLMTGFTSPDDRLDAIEAGADDFLAKPVDADELRARVRSLIRLKRYTDDLDSAEDVILGLALTVEARDPHTTGHCERLAEYAVALGQRIGLPDDDLDALRRGAYLHDVGKIGVPDAVLLKPGPLTEQEHEIIRRHPEVGDRLCGTFRALRRVRPIVRHHHERLDGSGYPDGLAGDGIPLLAQIIGIVDVYDALTSERPYKRAYPPMEAGQALRDEVRRGWRRADLVEAFLDLPESRELISASI